MDCKQKMISITVGNELVGNVANVLFKVKCETCGELLCAEVDDGDCAIVVEPCEWCLYVARTEIQEGENENSNQG